MTSSSDAAALADWIAAVTRELGIEGVLDGPGVVDTVLDLTADVAHGVSRPGAPVTAFLVGVAAGRAADATAATRAYAAAISRLTATWPDPPPAT